MTGGLVVAKAPVSGRVKTRLGADVGMDRAAELAAAALLDTLAAVRRAFGADRCHLALDGDLAGAVRGAEIAAALETWTIHRQRGVGLGARLRNAHEDVAAALGEPVVQVGMDTPQVTAALLSEAAGCLTSATSAVLGEAYDGGWWLLGVGDPALVRHLASVPMSAPNTCAGTRSMLATAQATVTEIEQLRDVDTAADAEAVAGLAPDTRFAEVWR